MWRTQRRYHADGRSYAVAGADHRVHQLLLLHCVDEDFGPFFLKFCYLLPVSPPSCASTATSGPSGRPPRPGSASARWTTGSPPWMTCRRCRRSATARPGPDRGAAAQVAGDPAQPVHRCGPGRRVPYELSVLQAEFSLTQVLDAPVSGRIFFEQVLRDNLDIGRPDQISLVFGRRIVTQGAARHPGPVPHPGHHRRGHPEPARRL